MSDKNKTLVRRSWEIPDNLDIIHEVYAPDLVWHDPDRDIKGAEEARQFVQRRRLPSRTSRRRLRM